MNVNKYQIDKKCRKKLLSYVYYDRCTKKMHSFDIQNSQRENLLNHKNINTNNFTESRNHYFCILHFKVFLAGSFLVRGPCIKKGLK